MQELHDLTEDKQRAAKLLRSGEYTRAEVAEQLDRTCYAMEIDPAYCDVIRQRYADFTDQPEYAP